MTPKRRGVGEPCAYCERIMEDRSSPSGLAATRDHHHPRSKGGRKIVIACRTCNSIKGNMLPRDWEDFMRCFPRWWENPKFAKIGNLTTGPKYVTAWDANGEPVSRYIKKVMIGRAKATKEETRRHFAELQAKARRENERSARTVPYAESMMVLRHGKDYWRAWKTRDEPVCECCRRQPGDWLRDLVKWSRAHSEPSAKNFFAEPAS